ncbi:MAG: low molecular weight phosphotyrosine protein phosphatase [Chitinophagales bacterium]|nr:low molecular weight phosphotyrosine protein phosphatase [Chitinophagales bacterium]
MVCLGNICRSPIAEGLMQHKIEESGLNWHVDSAGTESYHIGSAPHRYSQEICYRNGIDISTQRARQFNIKDFERYDKIYALAQDVYEEIREAGGSTADMSKVDLLLNELDPGENESVPDPYYGGAEGYTLVYDLIDRACEAIVEKYK